MESFNIYRSNIYGSIHIFDRFLPFWWWWWWWWTLSILDFATHSFVYNTVYVFLCVWLNVCQVFFFCCFLLLSIIIILKNYSVNRSNLWERKQSTLFVPSSSTTTTTTTARWFLSFFFINFQVTQTR